ncbi:transcriptional regulator [Candidatus Bathyarchaeota archaeon]|nr:MAG: transcriptional regulator [Candidatus Hecatellales archaeon]RLI34841.1 MAG: transcriptional regulator [Candidatus Bathyarchaeota archaeon]
MFSKRIFEVGFKKALEEELKRRKMSIRELAEKTGLPLATLYKITSGERDPRFSTVKRIVEVLEPSRKPFIAVIAAKFILDQLRTREIKVEGRRFEVREYPATSIEDCIVAAVKAEKEGASGLICAPVFASIIEKLVDIPVVILKPGEAVLKDALKDLAGKLSRS